MTEAKHRKLTGAEEIFAYFRQSAGLNRLHKSSINSIGQLRSSQVKKYCLIKVEQREQWSYKNAHVLSFIRSKYAILPTKEDTTHVLKINNLEKRRSCVICRTPTGTLNKLKAEIIQRLWQWKKGQRLVKQQSVREKC